MLLIVLLGTCDPQENISLVAILAFCVSFFSASQDIVIDAYRTEILEAHELGAGAALANFGYRIGALLSGSVALILSDSLSWSIVYSMMAIAMLVGVVATILSENSDCHDFAPRSLHQAVVAPLRDFASRTCALEILVFIVLYKLGDQMAVALTTKFMLEIGFSKTDIGLVVKGFGLVANIGGSILAGAWMARITLQRALVIFGIIQAVGIIPFAILAAAGKSYTCMTLAICAENFCTGMGTAAFLAFLMSLCNKRFTASQYAILSSLPAITRVLSGTPTGYMVEAIGWQMFFVLSTTAALPGLFLLFRYKHWKVPVA